jgi:hypothetical protein
LHLSRLSRLYLIVRAVENKQFATGLFQWRKEQKFMAATGELIRLINYVDDITTTLRRIHASLPAVDTEEKKRLAEALKSANERIKELLSVLEK